MGHSRAAGKTFRKVNMNDRRRSGRAIQSQELFSIPWPGGLLP